MKIWKLLLRFASIGLKLLLEKPPVNELCRNYHDFMSYNYK